eukprot:gene6196-6432_t
MDKWQQVLAAADTAVDAAASDPGGRLTAFAGDAVWEMQQLPEVLVRLLDGLARYPGSHIKPAELTQLLQSIDMHQLHVQQMQQLLTATAALQLQPSRTWWQAAAHAVAGLLPSCSVADQALLLVGLTAAGYLPEQDWWRLWFEETASRCAELEVASQVAAGQVLQHPQSFATRHKPLFSQLIMPVQRHMHELSSEQLTQAVEVVAAFSLKVGVDWLRWHAAAVLRLGRTFPLECLVRVRDSYRFLQFAPEDRMQSLLGTVNWRVKQQQQRQQHQEKLKQQGAVLFTKNEQRRSQNERDKAAREAKAARKAASSGGAAGAGTAPPSNGKVGPAGKQQWRTRKLRLPGTLDRKF